MTALDDATYNQMNEERYTTYLKPALAFLRVAQNIDPGNNEYSTMVDNIQSLLGDR